MSEYLFYILADFNRHFSVYACINKDHVIVIVIVKLDHTLWSLLIIDLSIDNPTQQLVGYYYCLYKNPNYDFPPGPFLMTLDV